MGEIVPTIIPQEFENFKIKFNKIKVGKPEITEADGSKRNIYPMEAKLGSSCNDGDTNPYFLSVLSSSS